MPLRAGQGYPPFGCRGRGRRPATEIGRYSFHVAVFVWCAAVHPRRPLPPVVALDEVAEQDQDREEEDQVRHGTNCPRSQILPTVADLTTCAKIPPC
ncbi:hypothetical protein GCM10017566_61390 [Amycolatopsis bartoniae]|uniref:Uncharacterized protein n=1 Tax=Amycolatopsis bartoniae TaxID=941986 RepID=A0A8H9J1H8_9PSEU|nr:hypothetical protein GCM10017566_61390 [Amycolatopsis bartoniae]